MWCVLLGGMGLACGGKPKPARRGKVDAVVVTTKRDAAVRPRPQKRKIAVGGGCACVVRAAGVATVKAERKALVRDMDRVNGGLRTLMAQIDKAVPDEHKDRIANPAPLRAELKKLTCRLDCLLHQVEGATGALWSYLALAARFLDEAQRAMGRLEAAPKNRPAGPTLAALTKLFNRTARTSNESIGLALINRPTPTVQAAVDASTWKAKVRRWRELFGATTSAFTRRWLPLIHRAKPSGPALGQSRGLRVALARLQQRLGDLVNRAHAFACKRGKGCTQPQAKWVAMGIGLKDLRTQLMRLAKQLREAGPTLSLSVGRRLSESADQAFAKAQKAALSL